jgi:hypothetical protein
MRALPNLVERVGRASTSCWSSVDDLCRDAPRALVGGWRGRRGLPCEVATGALLLAVWIALWTVFIAGVVQPAAAFQMHARRPVVLMAVPSAEVTTTVALAGATERSGR